MRLSDADILRLLPAFMRDDTAVTALTSGSNDVIRQLANKIRLLSTWDHLDDMTSKELDELAWELNIPWYDNAASDEAKRIVIKQSDQVYATLGTKWAVEQVVTAYFFSALVREWWEYGGQPYHFQVVRIDGDMIEPEVYVRLESAIRKVKNVRSWLDGVSLYREIGGTVYAGGAIYQHKGVEIQNA